MKLILIAAAILMAFFIIVQIYFLMSESKTETQKYTVVLSKENFEIRLYPATTMASIVSSTKSYRELGSTGFRKLAGYIFGGNDGKQKISMTTPVRMEINDAVATMSFVMPSIYNWDNLPKPNDKQVVLKSVPEEYVAAIKFGGYASESDIETNSQKLLIALTESKINFYGNFQLLTYNAPYQLINRRNEIIVNVYWDKSNE